MDTDGALTGLAKVEIRRVDRRKILARFEMISQKIEYLFAHPIKFNVEYLQALNLKKLEIFLMTVNPMIHPKVKGGGVEWLIEMGERQRRKVFFRTVKQLKVRKWTWEEIQSLRIALGYPAQKPSKFRRNVQEAINDLIKQLKKDLKYS